MDSPITCRVCAVGRSGRRERSWRRQGGGGGGGAGLSEDKGPKRPPPKRQEGRAVKHPLPPVVLGPAGRWGVTTVRGMAGGSKPREVAPGCELLQNISPANIIDNSQLDLDFE